MPFMAPSPIPCAIRMRLALPKMGMKFIDDGKVSLIVNENPIPRGEVVAWEELDQPDIRFYKQTIVDE